MDYNVDGSCRYVLQSTGFENNVSLMDEAMTMELQVTDYLKKVDIM